MAARETVVLTEFQPENSKISPYTEPLLPVTNQLSKENTTFTITAKNIAKNFLRLITIIFLAVLFICSLVIILSFCAAPQKPIFQLNSLSVSNFTISKTKLAGIWFANLTIENPNMASQVSFERIESMVFYKENDALATTSVDGFDSDLIGQNKVEMKFETTGHDGGQPTVGYPVLRQIEEDRKSGLVRFSIRMSVWATYKTGNYWFTWRRRALLNIYCLDLNVNVAADKENGSLIGAGERYCDVVVLNINSEKS